LSSSELLAQYVTNPDGQVFAIQNLQGMVGAVMARYSRAEGGLRRTLLNEFIKEDQLKLKKAYKLIERVLIEYGDDSVGELEGAHLSFEDISLLATKIIEHRRIGGSPIEQSTRYIRYDSRDERTGRFRYFTPQHWPESAQAEYARSMDRIFENYARMFERLAEWLERRKPLEEAVYDLGEDGRRWDELQTDKAKKAFKRTHRNDIKTKTCDVLRAYLPLATCANVGLFGNGRFFQHLISKMLTAPFPEANRLGGLAFEELSKVIPHYVKRAKRLEYLAENERCMRALCQRLFGDLEKRGEADIALIEPDERYVLEQLGNGPLTPEGLREARLAEEKTAFLAALAYGHARGPFDRLRARIQNLDAAERREIMDAYYGERKKRRDRPERGIEYGYPYTFDLVTEWAVYKDLMRHRMGTIQVQPMAPDLGFETPQEMASAGLDALAQETLAVAESLYAWLADRFPHEREYAMLQGHRVRWLLGMNDRALMHMVELRTAPQGHVNYRKACQTIHRLAASRYPGRAERMRFVDYADYYWARDASEARQRRKEQALDKARNGD